MDDIRFVLALFRQSLRSFGTRTPRTARLHASSGRWLMLLAAILLVTLGAASRGMANEIYVSTTQPGMTDANNCSLQEAIYSANFDNNIAIDSTNPDVFYSTGCVPGSGADTIELPAGAVFQLSKIVDDAHNPYGPTATPIIFSIITIEANGATVERVGSVNVRAFTVGTASIDTNPGGTANVISGTGSLTIRNAYITGFTAKGGNGATGGGGGMGAGGAIYVDTTNGTNGNSLTVENSTFQGNGAIGGDGGGIHDSGPGGGGGGSRGNGGGIDGVSDHTTSSGGGGGGTITDGWNNNLAIPNPPFGHGGFACGGQAGDFSTDGNDAPCPGGGGGGGGTPDTDVEIRLGGDGGNGNYGGGGGGGGYDGGQGQFGRQGGDGGFGGGGGAGDDTPGTKGQFGGNPDHTHGGGGAALGGAIFSHFGGVTIENSTFTGNFVVRGNGGGGTADNGQDEGGAIFASDGTLTVLNATLSGNTSTGEGGGIVVIRTVSALVTSFTLDNTILANPTARECFFLAGVTAAGFDNLIVTNFGCPGNIAAMPGDPQLGPLQINAPGNTPTMAIPLGSPAVDAADPNTSRATDQRGVPRPQGAGYDIGAFEAAAPAADLSLTKMVSSSTAQPGDTVTYTLTVTNLGPLAANNVQLSDDLPSTVTFASCDATGGGVCGGSGNSVTVSYTTLAANAPVTITLTATLNAGVADGTTVGNTASVTSSSPDDPNSNNNSATATFKVQNKADLTLTKQVSATTVLAGGAFTYTVTLHNAGPYDARNVVLTDPLPAGVTFNSCASTVNTCSLSASGASVSLASFANGASATVTIQATLNFSAADGSTISNTATVAASTFDPNLNNNSATANFVAHNKADLFVTNKPNATSVKSTANLVYTVTVKNLGPYQAAAVVMNDPVPSNSTFVKLSASVSCTAPAKKNVGTISCNLGNMASGASATVTITVTVDGSGNKTSITDTAEADSPTFDPNLANNSATVTVPISGNKK